MVDKPHFAGHILLEEMHCRKAHFEQRFVPGEVERLSADLSFPLTIGLKVHDPGNGPCVVELRIEITHDREGGQPYDVDVAYIGRFGIGDLPDGLSRDGFARQNAAMIMFPFVRSAIADITMKGSVGPLFLPPVNIVAMLEDSLKEDIVSA